MATDQFLRYSFELTAAALRRADGGASRLAVTFDPAIGVDGRFTACTGGWDWAPYSKDKLEGSHVFSKGIWKSVYLTASDAGSAAIAHVVPQIAYLGEYPTGESPPDHLRPAAQLRPNWRPNCVLTGVLTARPAALVDGKHAGFSLDVRVFLSAGEPPATISGWPPQLHANRPTAC